MRVSIYENFPNEAKEIRKAVFMNEQGFQNEFDDIDHEAAHFVLFDDDEAPAATCRVFWDDEMNAYVLGRLAVLKEYRGRNLGSLLLQEVERYVAEKEGKDIVLHAQCRAVGFYGKMGFIEYGAIENDEGCPHIWMKKSIKRR